MKPYSVTYQHLSWAKPKVLKDVGADGVVNETGARYFILKNSERVEVPTKDFIFIFSKERAKLIQDSLKENEKNQGGK